VAGFLRGVVDTALLWIADVSFGTPQIVIVMAILAIFSQSVAAAMIAYGALGGLGLIRIVRTETLAVKQEEYVAAAQVAGLSMTRILGRHILPRIAGPIIVQASIFASFALLFETALQFLGLATTPPAPSWGGMVAEGSQFIATDPWMIVPGGLAIAVTVIALGLVGDAVRDTYAALWSPAGNARENRRAERTSQRLLAEATREGRAVRAATEPREGRADRPDDLLEVREMSIGIKTGDGLVPVVDKVSFTIRAGEAVGLVGESGCGKTLTALALLGLLPPAAQLVSGEVRFGGETLHLMNERDFASIRGSKIALISQEPIASLDPSFSCGAQLAEVVRLHKGLSRAAARKSALELLDMVSLPNPRRVSSLFPHELSGGMAQRVAIAIAIATQPRMLVADEPTTALDVSVEAEILDVLSRLQKELGLATLLISHNWSIVSELCDRVHIMYAGEIVEQGETSSVFALPRHPYTAGLLATDPRRNLGRSRLPALAGSVPSVGEWPGGCRFAARCEFATGECAAASVPDVQLEADHTARCIRLDAITKTIGQRATSGGVVARQTVAEPTVTSDEL
jgi:peptide/nickel transport system permease protein